MTTQLTSLEWALLWAVLVVAVLGLVYAWYLWAFVRSKDMGSEKMIEVWQAIRDGAEAYLRQQFKAILPFIVLLTVALFFSVYIVKPTPEALEFYKARGVTDINRIRLLVGFGRAVAFILGAFSSLAVGQLGMRVAVAANVRVTAASRRSFREALQIAFRAGTITGMLTNALGLLGGTLIFMVYQIAAPDVLLGFGFGGTLLALFMRVGGGIYTKAADVGADLVGKVEAGIPEDDPRNPAVIADLVGDNVGDCAGMAADIFESYEVTIVSALILGLALWAATGSLAWVVFPLVVRAIGVLASIVGTYLVDEVPSAPRDAMKAIFRGYVISAVISAILVVAFGYYYLEIVQQGQLIGGWWRAPLAVLVGLVLATVLDRITNYFTGTTYSPVQEIRNAAETGSATVILQGLVVGLESSVWSALAIAATVMVSVAIFLGMPVDPATQVVFVLYGVALAGIGLLTLTGNIVAMDSYGPIADNAGGIAEMAWTGMDDEETEKAQSILDHLDAVGNTTKAITKGLAIGTAVLAAVALFASYLVDVTRAQKALGIPQAQWLETTGIRINIPEVFVGLLIGGTVPFLFSSFAIQAVRRGASAIVLEVRRQFRMGVLEGKVKPDYQKAVGISTATAQKELLPLALLGVVTPIIVGLWLKAEALGAFLAGAIVAGQLLAVFMNNAGGAWDNAKKLIEDEPKQPEKNLGKGSERHKASVVGDTVGDPLKDTAGPAMNPMIKVVNLVSVIIAPIVVQYELTFGVVVVILLLVAVLAWVVRQAKKPALRLTQEE